MQQHNHYCVSLLKIQFERHQTLCIHLIYIFKNINFFIMLISLELHLRRALHVHAY